MPDDLPLMGHRNARGSACVTELSDLSSIHQFLLNNNNYYLSRSRSFPISASIRDPAILAGWKGVSRVYRGKRCSSSYE
jgi:hypothetical protein